MRLPTDPAKLKLLSREYILKHCRALEKKADAFKKQLQEPKKKFTFLLKDGSGYYVFEDVLYAVGKPTKFRDLTEETKHANMVCFVSNASEAYLICRALNILALLEESK